MRPSLRLGRGFARLSSSTRRQREEEKRRRREAGGQPTTGARSPRSEGRGTQSGGISKRGGNRGVGGGGEERRRRWGMVRRVPPALRYFPLFSSTYRPRQPPPLFHLSPGSRRSPRKPPSPSKAGREPPSSSTDEEESDEEEPSPKSVPARSSQEKEEEEEEEEPKKDEDYDSDLLESSDYDDGDDDVDDADSGGVLVFEARRGPFRARVRRTLDRRYTNHRIGVKVYQVRFGVVRERGAELDAVDAGIFHLYGLLEEVSVLVKGDEKKGCGKGRGTRSAVGGRARAQISRYTRVPAGTCGYPCVPAGTCQRPRALPLCAPSPPLLAPTLFFSVSA
jgi:hypothetical protein